MDRYKNISDYIKQKKNIFTKEGINIISIDDIYSKKIFLNLKNNNKISFSTLDKSADFYIGNNIILDNYFSKNKIIYINDISQDLKEHFNNQNILIAYICNKILKLPINNFLNVVKNFKGLPFRSNLIFDNKKLKVINNSKSTNINSTVNSIINYKKIYLILGGIAKEKNFEIFCKYKDKIETIYTFGKSSLIIEKKLKKTFNTKRFKNLSIIN